jgi:outer membrane protein assembly complex protein YaeT
VNPQNGELTGRGFLSAAAVARWVGGVEAEGRLEADLRWSPLRGGSGSLRLEGMRILSDLLPFPVEALSGAALLEGSRLRLEGVRGQSASGSFELSGEAPVSPSSGNWDLELAARQIPLRQPPGLQATADARLRLQGSHGSPRLAGEVKILQGVYTLPLELGRGVPRLSLDPGAILPGMLSAVGLDVALSVQHLWMRSEYTRLECHGNVRLSGTVRRPVLGGQVAAVEGGELRFNQVRYRVSSGLMELTGSERNDPRISLNAETERGEYTLFLQVRGTLENLQVALRSDPPLPTAEVVRLLTTGREAEPGDTPAGALAGGLVGSVVGGRVLTPLQSGLQSFLPVDRLEIDPLAVSGQGDPTARITLGKQLSRRVSLSYSSTLGNNQEDLYQLRYRLQPDLDLTASREDDGSIGGDLRHSRRFYPPGTRPAREPQEARPLIRRVRFRGDSPLSRRRMRAAVTLIPGEPASLFELVDSQEKVWRAHARAGYPKAVIRASLRPRRRDSADAVFEIEKGSPLQIRLEGAPLPRALEAELLDLWQEVDLRALVAARAEARIAEHFRQQGYPAADARLRAESRQPDSELWIFDVHTGRRAEVRSLRFEGASRIPERDLLAAIETRADFPGDRGLFIASRLLSDTNALRRLYAEHGYRDAEVELEPPHFSGDGREALVSWRIEEGLLYTVAKVEVSESAASLFEDALETLRLIPGAPFSERTLAEDQNRLAARLDRRGYPQARVEARVEGVPEALRIRYEVEPGPRRLVGEVRIEGNRITRDSVIRKELAFAPGDPLSQQRLEQSQRNLYELGVFRSVSVEAQEAESDPAGVRVRVIESAPLTLGAGVGYDSVDRFRGRLDISNRNLFGTRRYAGGVARAGSTERRIQALLRDPRLFGSRLAGLASWFYEEEERDTFDVIRRGARLQIEQRPSPRVTLFYRYALSEEDLSEVSVTTEAVEPEQRLAHLGWSLAYDSRDDFADPHRGLYGSLDLKWFSETLASQAEFARVFLQASYYRSLGRRLVWASGLRFGVAEPLGADSLIPITERFFAGGDNSVRGFKRDRLGPIDPVTGDPLGGELSILVNQELRFPVWRFLRGVVFYDGGSVVAEPDDFQRRSLRHVLGAGVRFDTPLGPVRLDYGRLLDRQTGEEPGALHFSIGHAF